MTCNVLNKSLTERPLVTETRMNARNTFDNSGSDTLVKTNSLNSGTCDEYLKNSLAIHNFTITNIFVLKFTSLWNFKMVTTVRRFKNTKQSWYTFIKSKLLFKSQVIFN